MQFMYVDPKHGIIDGTHVVFVASAHLCHSDGWIYLDATLKVVSHVCFGGEKTMRFCIADDTNAYPASPILYTFQLFLWATNPQLESGTLIEVEELPKKVEKKLLRIDVEKGEVSNMRRIPEGNWNTEYQQIIDKYFSD